MNSRIVLTADTQGGAVVKNLPSMQNTQDMWVQFLGWEDLLEEGISTHSSIFVWTIRWIEEPGGLQSSWGHKESDTIEHTHTHTIIKEKIV